MVEVRRCSGGKELVSCFIGGSLDVRLWKRDCAARYQEEDGIEVKAEKRECVRDEECAGELLKGDGELLDDLGSEPDKFDSLSPI